MKSAAKNIKEGGPEEDGPAEPMHLATLKKIRIMIRAAQRHSAWIEKQCGISGGQLWILQELYESPGLRVGEIARRLAVHQTTASNLLDALERKGYLVKTRDASDHRIVKVTLSKDGEELLKRSPKPARGLLPEALMKMDPAALSHLDKGLQSLLQVIELDDELFSMQLLPFNM
jgi:DNA-binding MarR family transcriptional regulator